MTCLTTADQGTDQWPATCLTTAGQCADQWTGDVYLLFCPPVCMYFPAIWSPLYSRFSALVYLAANYLNCNSAVFTCGDYWLPPLVPAAVVSPCELWWLCPFVPAADCLPCACLFTHWRNVITSMHWIFCHVSACDPTVLFSYIFHIIFFFVFKSPSSCYVCWFYLLFFLLNIMIFFYLFILLYWYCYWIMKSFIKY